MFTSNSLKEGVKFYLNNNNSSFFILSWTSLVFGENNGKLGIGNAIKTIKYI